MAVIALLGAVNCVKLEREPLLTWAPTPADDGPPKNYFVPHFGADEEKTTTMNSIAKAEEIVGAKFISDADVLKAAPEQPDPRNYFVPHFGYDADVVDTLKHAADAGVQLKHNWVPAPPPDEPPRDYFVPHFGADWDVKNAIGSAAQAEKMLDHKWDVLAPSPADPPRNYFVPHFGTDNDIKDSAWFKWLSESLMSLSVPKCGTK
jgi:hypothetical protein